MLVNAPHFLPIPTYDGSGQCVHPDVVATNRAFYDAAYAMVIEPYPFADASLENPSIVTSNDGLLWSVPPGLVNPVVQPPSTAGWNSDAALFNNSDRVLRLYYRFNSGRGETTLFLRQSEDGIRWSHATPLLRYDESARFASPSVIRFRDAMVMVFIDTSDQSLKWLRSADGMRWEDPAPIGSFPAAWHIAAQSHLNWLYLLLTDRRTLYLLRFQDGRSLQLFDGEGWTSLGPLLDSPHAAKRLPAVLTPSQAGWDSKGIYRASFRFEGDTLRVWYSACSHDGQWHIGYTHGSILDW